MDSRAAFLQKVGRIRKIPTLPEVMQEVLATVASSDSSATDLAAILSNDQAMCTRVLKMANSAFYAQTRRISSIGDAVVVLGFDEIVQLMLATTVFTAFDTSRMGRRLGLYELWKHSMATATTSKMIAEKVSKGAETNIFHTAGLLHDIGKLVLAHYFPVDYASVFERLESEDIFLCDAEKSVLGFTHCDVAEWLYSRWNFPRRLIDIISAHHKDISSASGMNPDVLVVRLANILCNCWQVGSGGNVKTYSLEAEDYSLLNLDECALEDMELKIRESEEEMDCFLKAIV